MFLLFIKNICVLIVIQGLGLKYRLFKNKNHIVNSAHNMVKSKKLGLK